MRDIGFDPVAPGFASYDSFEQAARSVVDLLEHYLEVKSWLVVRLLEGRWRALCVGDMSELEPGDAVGLANLLCSSMDGASGSIAIGKLDAQGGATRVAASVGEREPYFVAAPMLAGDRTGGFLCGLSDSSPALLLELHRPLVESCVRLLSTVSEQDQRAANYLRWAKSAEAKTLLDPLTGLLNRRGWDRLLDKEEARAHRYGIALAIFVLDLDRFKQVNDFAGHAAGDKLLQRTASVLRRVMRNSDVVARLGGDEFGILAIESDYLASRALYRRLNDVLTKAGISVSLGVAQMQTQGRLIDAWRDADRSMYHAKRRRFTGATVARLPRSESHH